tara:strand:- start:14 stop:202 length:189 start_codon:yes stop_codon:yes gene_type:complete
MRRHAVLVAVMAALGSLSACHTDPFGLEPEVDVTLPEDEPNQSAPDPTADAALGVVSRLPRY